MNVLNERWAFLGLHYFDDDPIDQQLFFGRDTEIKELTEKVLAENVTLLFGRSGDGKTSLINAGLKQKLRNLGYFPIRARVFNNSKKTSAINALYYAVEVEAIKCNISLPNDWRKETLWETFYHLRPSEENKLKPIVLIMDQFEELFTVMEEKKDERDEFIQQFADLVRGRLPQNVREKLHKRVSHLEVGSSEAREIERLLFGSASAGTKVLLSLREDYLAFLENFDELIPTVFDSRFRIDSLSHESARDAIDKPPRQQVLGERAFQFSPEAIEEILKFLTVESSRAGKNEQVVGPPQLQILCRQLEERLRIEKRNLITIHDLGGEKGMRRYLTRYYREIYKRFPIVRLSWGPKKRQGILGFLGLIFPFHFPRLAIRKLCEDRLITANGSRNSRHEEEIVTEIGVAKRDLNLLVETRLLRREPRLKEAFYELSHDSLVYSLRIAGSVRHGLAIAIKIIYLSFIFGISTYWIVPYIFGRIALDSVKQDLLLTKQEKMSVEAFRDILSEVKGSQIGKSTTVTQIVNDFDAWRIEELTALFLNAKTPMFADSILDLIRLEYPGASQIPSFVDTLHNRKISEVKQIYSTLLPDSVNVFRKSQLDSVSLFLDSVFLDLKRDPEVMVLQADLSGKYGDWNRKQTLLKEIERQNNILRTRMLAAVKLRTPKILRVKGSEHNKTTFVDVVLEPDEFLSRLSVRFNGEEIRNNRGFLMINPDSNSVVANIQITNHQGVSAIKDYRFEIDRTPPSLVHAQIYYTDTSDVEWMEMKDDVWQGKLWQIRGQANEELDSCSALIVLTGWHSQAFRGKILQNRREFVIEGTNKDLADFERLNLKIKLTDLVGWSNSISLGEWHQTFATGLVPPKRLRAVPRIISVLDVQEMIIKNNFFDILINKKGSGFANDFEEITIQGSKLIADRNSGLTWQQSGSNKPFRSKKEVLLYLDELNTKKHAGYDDWRLPTLEEAMSLLEPRENDEGLFMSHFFDKEQQWIWTSDEVAEDKSVWFVDFKVGGRGRYVNENEMYGFVRAVRQ
ncbi:hypothetical protein DCC62_18225 [candidate division KSB1 bacterium]|nr:MAG: hypothetical protein DCC62_18225 [candidate division KSB1 bacterium]